MKIHQHGARIPLVDSQIPVSIGFSSSAGNERIMATATNRFGKLVTVVFTIADLDRMLEARNHLLQVMESR
jgi:hypothetical protein